MVGSEKDSSVDVEEPRFERQQDRVNREVGIYPFPHPPIVTELRQKERLRVLRDQLKVQGCLSRRKSIGPDRKHRGGKEHSCDDCRADSSCCIASYPAERDCEYEETCPHGNECLHILDKVSRFHVRSSEENNHTRCETHEYKASESPVST